MFDFAVLADDEKATLPTQVNQILCYKSYVRTLVIIDSHWFLNFFNQYPGRTNELMPYNHVWHPTSLWGYNFKQYNLYSFFQFTICSSVYSDALITTEFFFQLLLGPAKNWITLSYHDEQEKPFKVTVRIGDPYHSCLKNCMGNPIFCGQVHHIAVKLPGL